MQLFTNRDVIQFKFEPHSTQSLIKQDKVIREVPIALVYNGISHTVMMGLPCNLVDFALGFSIAEGILHHKNELYDIEIIEHKDGIEIQMEISSRQFMALKNRRRTIEGRTGCGLCGVEHLSQFQNYCKDFPQSNHMQHFDPAILDQCLNQLESQQYLAQATGGSHAAAYFTPDGKLCAIREDVGRHIALDKLLGWYIQNPQLGFIIITSRASFEMVQKCLACGIEILVAISATTDMAIELAQQHHLTLLGFTRQGRTTVYSAPERLISLAD